MANLNPYISFKNNARDAMEFYRTVLGGDLIITTFADFPDMVPDPAERELVMHSQLTTDDGLVLMGSDTPSTMPYAPPTGISVSYSGSDVDELRRIWDGLSDGGTVAVPFAQAPWGAWFGMFTDRFGIAWMVASEV
ncbi:VOC family protein [Gordonia humi]|uniref:PhnB protein n=1 Tax=Gordonia humi TaxID=686429 RepID=A0A840EXD1_9ACTN|nr:VOC family protein [Gordonia humi]MBB4134943.1 PhnB protein [Gordonia humi]